MILITAMIGWGAGTAEVRAQTDLNAGKSGAQMFASNCAACHRSPAGLTRSRDPYSVARFLTEHYTSRPENAGAIAAYIIAARGTAPAQRASTPGEAAVPAVTAPTAARQPPLQKITTATVERLKSFAAAADVAVPSDPNTPPRGVKQIEAYAATGTAPDLLRQTAVNAALRQARAHSSIQVVSPGTEAPAGAGTKADGTAATTDVPPATTGAAVLQLRGPPASGAIPTRQSNGDQF